MKIELLCFAALRDETGFSKRTLEVPPGTSVADVWTRLQSELDSIAALPIPLTAVNEVYEDHSYVLEEGDVLALIPPVSGG